MMRTVETFDLNVSNKKHPDLLPGLQGKPVTLSDNIPRGNLPRMPIPFNPEDYHVVEATEIVDSPRSDSSLPKLHPTMEQIQAIAKSCLVASDLAAFDNLVEYGVIHGRSTLQLEDTVIKVQNELRLIKKTLASFDKLTPVSYYRIIVGASCERLIRTIEAAPELFDKVFGECFIEILTELPKKLDKPIDDMIAYLITRRNAVKTI